MATQPRAQAGAPRPAASPDVLKAARETAPSPPAPPAIDEAKIRAEIEAKVRAEIEAQVRAEAARTLPKELDEGGGTKMRNMDQARRDASAAAAQRAQEIALARLVLGRGVKPADGFVPFMTARKMSIDAKHVPNHSGDGLSIKVPAGTMIQLPASVADSLEAQGAGRVAQAG